MTNRRLYKKRPNDGLYRALGTFLQQRNFLSATALMFKNSESPKYLLLLFIIKMILNCHIF